MKRFRGSDIFCCSLSAVPCSTLLLFLLISVRTFGIKAEQNLDGVDAENLVEFIVQLNLKRY